MHSLGLDIKINRKEFAFDTGCAFRGLTISENIDGWNIVIRAYDKRNAAVYAMTTSTYLSEGLIRLYAALRLGNGETLWRPDRYAKPMGGA